MPLHELMMISDLRESVEIGSELGREQRHSNSPPHDYLRLCWVGMWKDLYCFALRIDMVLPDWRGFTGLVRECPYTQGSPGPIGLKLAAQPHILKGTWRSALRVVGIAVHACVHGCLISGAVCCLSITFAWLLCARRESPLDGQMRFSRSSPHPDGSS